VQVIWKQVRLDLAEQDLSWSSGDPVKYPA
jgi:hypothetical protein